MSRRLPAKSKTHPNLIEPGADALKRAADCLLHAVNFHHVATVSVRGHSGA
jgi:hypothetical protein